MLYYLYKQAMSCDMENSPIREGQHHDKEAVFDLYQLSQAERELLQ